MALPLRIGLAGLVLGILIAVAGGLAGEIPPLQILLRALLAGIFGSFLFLLIWSVAKKYLPELVQEADSTPEGDGFASNNGSTIDIVLQEDESMGADQAQELRAMRAQSGYRDNSEDDEELIEEVADDAVASTAPLLSQDGFSEDAFYSGIEQLPDIGGFTESFTPGGEDGSSTGTDDSGPMISPGESISSGSGSKGGMDSKLMAQAISTALKKDQK